MAPVLRRQIADGSKCLRCLLGPQLRDCGGGAWAEAGPLSKAIGRVPAAMRTTVGGRPWADDRGRAVLAAAALITPQGW